MRIAYYTLDEVNRFLVRRVGPGGGPLACPGGHQLKDEYAGATAVLLDLDFLPADVRADWVRRVLAGEVGLAGPGARAQHPGRGGGGAAGPGAHVCRGRVRKAALWRARLDGQAVRGGGGGGVGR